MKIGDNFKLGKKTYTILNIYPKRQPEKDVLLCEDKHGIKECFQRYDLTDYVSDVRQKRQDYSELKDRIREMLKSGLSRRQTMDKLVAEGEVLNYYKLHYIIAEVDVSLGHRTPRRAKKIEQLDDSGNVVNTFESIVEASKKLNYSTACIVDVCNGRAKRGRYKLRYAEVEDD